MSEYNFYPGMTPDLAFPVSVRQRNGISPLTTNQINSLPSDEKWVGRVVYNMTLQRLQRYVSEQVGWVIVPEFSAGLDSVSTSPSIDGTIGTSNSPARHDHVHKAPTHSESNLSTPNMPLNSTNSKLRAFRIGKQASVSFIGVLIGPVAGTVTLSLPWPAKLYNGTHNRSQMLGQAMATDSGVRSWPMWIYLNNENTAGFMTFDGNDLLTPTSPFTWASGDTISGTFSYETA